MNRPDSLNEQTRSEWRELGFFYTYDDAKSTWTIRANRQGLLKFSATLKRYAADSRHEEISQHEHYGPYGYFKFVTWHEPKITEDGIYGTLGDFVRLADAVEQVASDGKLTGCSRIEPNYSEKNEASLELYIEADSFEPAEADESLQSG